MIEINERRRFEVLVELQQALLGEISNSLRAVTVSYTDKTIHYDCYYDGEISDEHRDDMSCVETELIAVFPEDHVITYDIHRKDAPHLIPKDVEWVFHRKEEVKNGSK